MPHKKESPLSSLKKTVIFYSTRAKKHIPTNKKKALELVKEELRLLFGRN